MRLRQVLLRYGLFYCTKYGKISRISKYICYSRDNYWYGNNGKEREGSEEAL